MGFVFSHFKLIFIIFLVFLCHEKRSKSVSHRYSQIRGHIIVLDATRGVFYFIFLWNTGKFKSFWWNHVMDQKSVSVRNLESCYFNRKLCNSNKESFGLEGVESFEHSRELFISEIYLTAKPPVNPHLNSLEVWKVINKTRSRHQWTSTIFDNVIK